MWDLAPRTQSAFLYLHKRPDFDSVFQLSLWSQVGERTDLDTVTQHRPLRVRVQHEAILTDHSVHYSTTRSDFRPPTHPGISPENGVRHQSNIRGEFDCRIDVSRMRVQDGDPRQHPISAYAVTHRTLRIRQVHPGIHSHEFFGVRSAECVDPLLLLHQFGNHIRQINFPLRVVIAQLFQNIHHSGSRENVRSGVDFPHPKLVNSGISLLNNPPHLTPW